MSNVDTNIFIFSAEGSEHIFGSENMTQNTQDVHDLDNLNSPTNEELTDLELATLFLSESGLDAHDQEMVAAAADAGSLRDAPPLSTPRESGGGGGAYWAPEFGEFGAQYAHLASGAGMPLEMVPESDDSGEEDEDDNLNVLLEDSNHDSPMSIVTASTESTETMSSTESSTESLTDSSDDSSTETILPSSLHTHNQAQAIDFINQIIPRSLQTNTVETQTEPINQCTVCYKSLTIENCVSTMCNHFFCKKCFYRWIEINATCPSCRAPINSKTNLTDEQLEREREEIYASYQETLILNCIYGKKNMKLIEQRNYLQSQNDSIMRSTIILRKKIAYNRGFNDGMIAARDKFEGGKGKKNLKWIGRFENTEWAHGFSTGYQNTKYDLAWKRRQYLKTIKRNKHKKKSNDLYTYGFTKNKKNNTSNSIFQNIKLKNNIIKSKYKNRKRVRVPSDRRRFRLARESEVRSHVRVGVKGGSNEN